MVLLSGSHDKLLASSLDLRPKVYTCATQSAEAMVQTIFYACYMSALHSIVLLISYCYLTVSELKR